MIAVSEWITEVTGGLPGCLSRQLSTIQVPRSVRQGMAAELSYGRHLGPPLCTARSAAVMILLCPQPEGWSIPLVVRPAEMKEHGGQIGLPGGAMHQEETPEAGALRELEEELGVPAHEVEVLGRLSATYLFVSDYVVTPIVGWRRQGVDFQPDQSEVRELILVPLDVLLDSTHRVSVCIRDGQVVTDALAQGRPQLGEVWIKAPAFRWGTHCIWGATAIMLAEFVELVRLAQPRIEQGT